MSVVPADVGKILERVALPFLPVGGGFEDEIFDLFKESRTVGSQPGQNIVRKLAVVRPGFGDCEFFIFNFELPQFLQPVGELERQ